VAPRIPTSSFFMNCAISFRDSIIALLKKYGAEIGNLKLKIRN
jgi:hypothetical protein